MSLSRWRTLSLVAAMPLAMGGCTNSAEPFVQLDCTTLALTLPDVTDLISTPSGLQYRDVVVGPGATVSDGDRVTTHYAACVRTGELFAEALAPLSTLKFTVGKGQVIAGLDEGVVGMKLGGRRQLVIPPSLGYGTRGSPGGFPVPNDTLIITVDAIGL